MIIIMIIIRNLNSEIILPTSIKFMFQTIVSKTLTIQLIVVRGE